MRTRPSPIWFVRFVFMFIATAWHACNSPLCAADSGLAEALDGPSLAWTTGGAVPWFAQTEVTHDGVDAAQGAVQIEHDRSWLETTTSEAGQLSFFWKCWSAWPDYDRLAFYIDGELMGSIPGNTDWQAASFEVGEGTHTLRWVFEVDSEPWPNYGAWLDQVQFVTAASNGRVVGWGNNMFGSLDIPPDLEHVSAIAASDDYGLALKTDGTVVAWGNYGDADGTSGPVEVPEDLSGVSAVAAGRYHSLALLTNGTVVGLRGGDWYGAGHVPEGLANVIGVACGYEHSLALKADGTVVAWGSHWLGQTNVPPNLSNVVAIAGGGWHSLAVRADGTVVAWGNNVNGQCDVPAGLSDVIAVTAGEAHSLALRRNGTVVGWGYASGGQIDIPPGLDDIVALGTGGMHSLLLKADGTVVALGLLWASQTNVPAGLSNVVAVAAGSWHSLALVDSGPPPPLLTLAEAVDAPQHEWTTGGAVPWWPQTDTTHDGVDAAQATVHIWHERSWLATSVTGPLRVGFFWKCSTFWPDLDRLAFYIDETLIGSIPGNTDWEAASFPVPPGEHSLQWVFEVESEPTAGHYNAWLDQVTFDTNVVITPPAIVRQPQSLTVPVGGDAFFTVSVEGTPPLRYQWQFEGEALSGETASQLVLTNIQNEQAGAYSVLVDNGAGVAVSEAASLSVVPPQSAWVWARQGGGSGYVNGGGGVAVDPEGNVLVTGAFTENAYFGPFLLTNSWPTMFFLAKYDPEGNVLWARQATSGRYSAAQGLVLATDAAGNAYAAGTFMDAMGDLSRARIAFDEQSVTNVGWFEDVFLVKYDSAGEPLWARRMGGPRQDFIYDLAVDRGGGVWITGSFGQAKYGSDGALLWVQNVNGLTGLKLAVDPEGYMYLSGRCASEVTLDGIVVGPGIFVLKYNPEGVARWAKTGAAGQAGSCWELACDVAGNLFLAGAFQETVSFDDLSLTATDSNAVFLMKYNAMGNPVWLREIARSAANISPQGLFFDGLGHLYFAAGFEEIVSVGGQWFSREGSDGVVLAQLDTTGEQRWAIKLPTGAGTWGGAMAADSAGRIFNTGCFEDTVDFGTNRLTCPYINAMYLGRLDANLTSRPTLAVRELPQLCQGGVFFTVLLNVTPNDATFAYAVEDQPPLGWAVSNVSNDGVFEVSTGKVKFGPFSDQAPRVLAYDIMPSVDVREPQFFAGTVSSDGINTAIGGDNYVQSTPLLHPADNNPANSSIAEDEVAAYNTAWRQGQSWPIPPNPIPIDYLTRAAALAQVGGCYELDPAKPPPMCWVPCETGARGAWSAAKPALLTSAVTSSIPALFIPGEPLLVSLTAIPAAGVNAFAVEDVVPLGWTVSSISHGGEFNPAQRRVKWGPFLDGLPRTLTYQTTAPENASGNFVFAGCASFDGLNMPSAPQRQTLSSCRLLNQTQSNAWPISLVTPLGAILQIEASTNLTHWVPLALLTNLTGRVEFIDPDAAVNSRRFYRAVLFE